MTEAFEAFLRATVDEASRTRRHGRPGLSARRKRSRADETWRLLRHAPDRGARLARLIALPQPTVRQIGCLLLDRLQPSWDAFARDVERLAEDEDWEVREWAVDPLLARWERDPDRVDALLQRWLAKGGRLRRAAVVAARDLVLHRSWPEAKALAVARAVLLDPDPYVQKNVGSYLVGDGLLRRFPASTLRLFQDLMAEAPPEGPSSETSSPPSPRPRGAARRTPSGRRWPPSRAAWRRPGGNGWRRPSVPEACPGGLPLPTDGRARDGGQPRRRLFRKNPRFAGRSARRRMKYGYQSGPKGT